MTSHYFDELPTVASKPRRVRLRLPEGIDVELNSDTGMFSFKALDRATHLLLTEGPVIPTEARDIADIGCGYGPIAVAIALRAPQARVLAVDVNHRALECLRQSCRRLELTNVEVVDTAEPTRHQFDMIWSNPPIRAGKTALQQLLLEWLPRLRPTGSAHLVIARNKGSDSLVRWLDAQGYHVTRRASRKGFRLLDVVPMQVTP